MLMTTKPKAYILVVVGEIASAIAVLLVLKPLPFVTLSIRIGSNAIALATPLKVFAFVCFTIAIQRIALTMRFSASISPLYRPPSIVLHEPMVIFCAEVPSGKRNINSVSMIFFTFQVLLIV